ncbi:MAG TPA: hypothetical protein VH761_07530 [Ilumatobacteraceae bacterium]
MSDADDDSPAERLARWTATDAAIGVAAEAEQLRATLAEREAEVADLRARLANLATRVGQLEADNLALRRSRVPMTMGSLAYRGYRRTRAFGGRVLRRFGLRG